MRRAYELLDEANQAHLDLFEQYLDERWHPTWAEVDSLLSQGKISGQYIEYLYVGCPFQVSQHKCLT